MKVIILGGFLGSGKTSVLLQLVSRMAAQDPDIPNRIAIIENEIGDIGVDNQTIGTSGDYTVQNMFSGCVCCTLIGNLLTALCKLRDEVNPAYVVIEPSGVANPGQISQEIRNYTEIPVGVVAVADAERWQKLSTRLGRLVGSQMQAADLVLLNKVDCVDEEALLKAEDSIRNLGCTCPIRRVSAKSAIEPTILDEICTCGESRTTGEQG